MAAGERLLVPFDLELKDRLYAVMLKPFYTSNRSTIHQSCWTTSNDHSKDSLIKISLGGLTHTLSTHV